ncbi:MAG: gamma-glutamyl-gamma-aminobutyrate hydrolase family protein, partial [Planctomycetota bacterium]
GKLLFAGLPNPMEATRYHSLVIQKNTLSDEFSIAAWTDEQQSDGEIMAIAHKTHPTFGVQFHPESFLTTDGIRLLDNFIQV